MLLPQDLSPDVVIKAFPLLLAVHVGGKLPEDLLHRFDKKRVSKIHDVARDQIHVEEIHKQSLQLSFSNTNAKQVAEPQIAEYLKPEEQGKWHLNVVRLGRVGVWVSAQAGREWCWTNLCSQIQKE